MRLLERVRADVTRPERPTARSELVFHVLAPLLIIAIAQIADPGTPAELLSLVPAVVAFVVRPLTALPAEVFAIAVVVPIEVVVGRDGNLEGVFFLSVIMVLYTSWTLGSVTRAAVIAGVASLGPWMVATQLAPDSGIGWTAWFLAHSFTFVLGRTLRRQRALIDDLEAAREQLARQAVADERRRMARELHDIAGHTVAAMALHVTGARHVLKRDIDEADAALRDAEAVGRDGLDQIRATVAALRTDERGTDPTVAGPADLASVVDRYRRAGLSVNVDIDESVTKIGGPVGVALHRIASESLTNVARHAAGNRADVRVRMDAGDVVLTVTDHGRAPRAAGGERPGFGILGMSERARTLGGQLTAGATSDGWRVEARLPTSAASAGGSSG